MKKLSIFLLSTILLSTIAFSLLASDQKQPEKQELITMHELVRACYFEKQELIAKHEALLTRYFPKGISSLALGATVKNRAIITKGPVHAVAVHNGRKLAFTTTDIGGVLPANISSISIWDLQDILNPKLVCYTPGNIHATSLAVSPDGDRLAFGTNNRNTGAFDITQLQNPVLIGTVGICQPNNFINAIAFSPDGQYVASGSSDNYAYVSNHHLLAQGRVAHKGYVNDVAFSSDSRYVATACEDKTVRIFDSALSVLSSVVRSHITAHNGSVTAVACAPQKKYFLTGSEDKTAKLWDMQDPANPHELAQLTGHTHAITCVKFSSCGNYALTASKDGTIRLWAVEDTQNPAHLGTLGENDNAIFSAEFGPEAQYVFAGTWENKARIWDLASCWIINDLTSTQIAFLVKLLSKSDELTAESLAIFQTLPEKLQQYIHKLRTLRAQFPRELTDIIVGYVGSSFAINHHSAPAAQQASSCVIS